MNDEAPVPPYGTVTVLPCQVPIPTVPRVVILVCPRYPGSILTTGIVPEVTSIWPAVPKTSLTALVPVAKVTHEVVLT